MPSRPGRAGFPCMALYAAAGGGTRAPGTPAGSPNTQLAKVPASVSRLAAALQLHLKSQ